MNPVRWKKIQLLFEETLELDKSERVKFLIERCGGDADTDE